LPAEARNAGHGVHNGHRRFSVNAEVGVFAWNVVRLDDHDRQRPQLRRRRDRKRSLREPVPIVRDRIEFERGESRRQSWHVVSDRTLGLAACDTGDLGRYRRVDCAAFGEKSSYPAIVLSWSRGAIASSRSLQIRREKIRGRYPSDANSPWVLIINLFHPLWQADDHCGTERLQRPRRISWSHFTSLN